MSDDKKPQIKRKYIVRILSTDLAGNKPIGHALQKIKGVKFMFANAICKTAGIDNIKITGDLSDVEIQKLNEVLSKPLDHNIPEWMLNRNKDYETGENKQVFGSDLDFAKMNDIKRLQKIKSYRGMRHAAKLPVRGQRTKSNFRKGKVLGVSKKK